MSAQQLLPDVENPLTRPFWQGLGKRELRVQQCGNCGLQRWPSALLCPTCLFGEAAWTALPGRGTLWSFVTYHRAFHPAFADQIPYSVGLVDVAVGIRLPGMLHADRAALRIGMPVEAVFEDVSEGVTLLRWTPSAGGT